MILVANWVKQIHGVPEIVNAIYDREIEAEEGARRVLAILQGHAPDSVLEEFIDVYEAADVPRQQFDYALEAMYDWADEARVWISPVEGSAAR